MKAPPSFAILAALALWSLGEARAEALDPAQDAVPPGAASSTGDTAPASPPADKTSPHATAFPAIPLQIRPRATNARFRYPFLGSVRAYSRSRVLRVHTRSGAVLDLLVKVFYAKSGNFLRAEFGKPSPKHFQSSAKTIEAGMRQCSEAITGLPDKTLPVSLETIFDHLHMPFEEATLFNITYVMHKRNDDPPKPALILNIFGLPGGVLSLRFGDDDERFRMERIIMDSDGTPQWEDNLL